MFVQVSVYFEESLDVYEADEEGCVIALVQGHEVLLHFRQTAVQPLLDLVVVNNLGLQKTPQIHSFNPCSKMYILWCHINLNKPATAQVGAISKAQKDSRKKISEFFEIFFRSFR